MVWRVCGDDYDLYIPLAQVFLHEATCFSNLSTGYRRASTSILQDGQVNLLGLDSLLMLSGLFKPDDEYAFIHKVLILERSVKNSKIMRAYLTTVQVKEATGGFIVVYA